MTIKMEQLTNTTCMMRYKTSSDATKHMRRIQEDHPFSVEACKARTNIILDRINDHDAGAASSSGVNPKIKTQRTLHDVAFVRSDEVRILSTRWLLSSGLPYTVIQNEKFQHMLRRLSNQTSLTVPDRDTIFAEGDSARFIELLSSLLKGEHELAHKQPFLSRTKFPWVFNRDFASILINIHGSQIGYNRERSNRVSLLFERRSSWLLNAFIELVPSLAIGLKENIRDNGRTVVTLGVAFSESLLPSKS
ncbi:hypothetical protein PHPALM_27932 [Phytophthora palmivora]|uniref:Uncharacterized protein n=1 Tax=Phytophthora palmivora TaxID=4796 RepID=A0A2P4XBC1_9STRA|nr:hypothetical protein PHPALM_27932 [Phytophthora palmivora]